MKHVKVGIVGGTGYTGSELLRLLVQHPAAETLVVTARDSAGQAVNKLFPNLRTYSDLQFVSSDDANLQQCDIVFFATPHGVAMHHVQPLLEAGVRIIDLSADFRLKDAAMWAQWYGTSHACPALLAETVYGLPEANRDLIRHARLLANPGCYPTAVQLGLLPLIKANALTDRNLVADVVTGVSGGGKKATTSFLFAEASDNFKAYGVSGHRHLPEIRQGLETLGGHSLQLTLVPHLAPMIRGMHATLYAQVSTQIDIQNLFERAYADEPFVDVLPPASHPQTREVRGSNFCRIAVYRPQDGERVVILVTIDNLLKGAAGQAVQNMNIMFDLPEALGLSHIALSP